MTASVLASLFYGTLFLEKAWNIFSGREALNQSTESTLVSCIGVTLFYLVVFCYYHIRARGVAEKSIQEVFLGLIALTERKRASQFTN
jgi:hypothetical protein